MRVLIAVTTAALVLAGCSVESSGPRHHAAAGPVAFVVQAPGSARANIVDVSPHGGRLRAVTRGTAPVVEAAWSADGTELVFARRLENMEAANTDGHIDVFVARRGGRPHLIRRCFITCDARSFAWSPDGRRIAFVTNIPSHFTGTAGEIAVINADGSGFHVVCDEARCGQGLDDPQWSPDGSQLVFSNMGVIGFPSVGILPSRVWVAGADGSDPHPLTQPHCRPGHPPLVGCAYDSAAAWSPSGRWIAFSRLDQDVPGTHTVPRTLIELMHPDGSDLHPLASCTGIRCNQVMQPVWSPDGARIAYAPKVERGPQVVLVTPGGRRTVVRTCTAAACVTPGDLAWAPSGAGLTFLAGVKVQSAFVIAATGRGMHVVGRDVQCCLVWLPSR
jgi:Tol biopolymer transport system component